MKRIFLVTAVYSIMAIIIAAIASARVLYVYPDGSGNYPNIQSAIDDAVDGDTVMLADGIFSGRANYDLRYNGKEITVCSQSGNAESCIIDVQGREDGISQRGFIFDSNENGNSILRDMTIINGSADALCPDCEGGAIEINHAAPVIINVICRDNFAASGGAISVNRGMAFISECQLINNNAFEGGAILCLDSSQVDFIKCLVNDNSATIDGGGITLSAFCRMNIYNCTISNNQSIAGSGVTVLGSDPVIFNSVISFNSGAASFYADTESNLTIEYTDIFGNSGGDWIDSITGLPGVNGNIQEDPLFADTASGNFHLTQYSPCIDSGDPHWPHDPDSTIADMGAFYFDQSSLINDPGALPAFYSMRQNYPNPFNASTTIQYFLPKEVNVSLDVYDILGRHVSNLVNNRMPAGDHQLIWSTENLPSGIYLYRLQTDKIAIDRRMLLLK